MRCRYPLLVFVILVTGSLVPAPGRACFFAKQDREYVIAFSGDEARIATARFKFERHGKGSLKGSSSLCLYRAETLEPEGECEPVETFVYTDAEGPLVSFEHDFFIDKVQHVRQRCLSGHRGFIKGYPVLVEIDHALAVWSPPDDSTEENKRKPAFYLFQRDEKQVQVALGRGPRREHPLADQLQHSDRVLFYEFPSRKRIIGQYSFSYGSAMHNEKADILALFDLKRFETFTVRVVGSSRARATKHFLGLLDEWGVKPERTWKSSSRAVIRARPRYAPLAEWMVFNLEDGSGWKVVVDDQLPESLRIEIPGRRKGKRR